MIALQGQNYNPLSTVGAFGVRKPTTVSTLKFSTGPAPVVARAFPSTVQTPVVSPTSGLHNQIDSQVAQTNAANVAGVPVPTVFHPTVASVTSAVKSAAKMTGGLNATNLSTWLGIGASVVVIFAFIGLRKV